MACNDQIDFPLARPMLDVLFALNGVAGRRKNLEVNELGDVVLLRMSPHEMLLVLINPATQIIGHANIERTTRPAGKNVDVVFLRHAGNMDGNTAEVGRVNHEKPCC